MQTEIKEYLTQLNKEDSFAGRIDLEAMEWLDDDWEDEYDEALEWYANCGGGEAEAAVRDSLANAVNEQLSIDVEKDYDFGDLLEQVEPVVTWG